MSLFGALSICETVLRSKKYAALYKPLVLRICEEEYKKYASDKERIKSVKNSLHTMYAAFAVGDSHKKAHQLLDGLSSAQESERQEWLQRILSLHASTRERLPFLHTFYAFVHQHIGPVSSVLDLGCGFNPFTLDWLPWELDAYHGFDINTETAALNNRYLRLRGMPQTAGCVDLTVETPPGSAEAVFLFKVLPVIERQAKGRSGRLIRELDTKHLVITYPTKSLSGKEKGMQSFYASIFEEMMGGNLSVEAKQEIGDELVYIIAKK